MSFTRTEVEKLKILIEKRFKSQAELAHLLKMTPVGLSKSINKSKKEMDGRLSGSLINKLKGLGLSITVELSDEFIATIINEEPQEFSSKLMVAEDNAPYGKKEIQKIKAENLLLKQKLKKLRAATKLRK